MGSIAGLGEEQCEDLAQVQVGDLLLIGKPDGIKQSAPGSECSAAGVTEEDGSEDHNGGGSEAAQAKAMDGGDQDQDDEDQDDEDQDDEDQDDEDQDDEDQGDEEDEDEDEFDDPRLTVDVYMVTEVVKRKGGRISDLALHKMSYSLKPAERLVDYFHIYGASLDHDATLEPTDLSAEKLTDIVAISSEDTYIIYPVNGNHVYSEKFDHVCPAGCDDGWLATQQDMHDLMSETITTITEHRPVCPVCMGKDLTQEYQALREIREGGVVIDMGALVEFYGRLNPRRRARGYNFRQFDERVWGYRFDDMLSEDEEGDAGWEYYDDALDTSADVAIIPASEEAVAALPRFTYAEKKTQGAEVETTCQICQDIFTDDTILAELPCGHFFCDDGCVPNWLKQSASCPLCRYRLPLKKEVEEGKEAETVDIMDVDGDGEDDEVDKDEEMASGEEEEEL